MCGRKLIFNNSFLFLSGHSQLLCFYMSKTSWLGGVLSILTLSWSSDDSLDELGDAVITGIEGGRARLLEDVLGCMASSLVAVCLFFGE